MSENEKEQIIRFDKTLQKIAWWSSVLIFFVFVIITLVYLTINKNKKKFYSDIKDPEIIKLIIFIPLFIPFLGTFIVYYSLKSAYKNEEVNDELNKKFYSYSENIVGVSILFIIVLISIFGILIYEHTKGRLVGRIV